jgi:hypothetical protein
MRREGAYFFCFSPQNHAPDAQVGRGSRALADDIARRFFFKRTERDERWQLSGLITARVTARVMLQSNNTSGDQGEADMKSNMHPTGI